MMPPLTCNEPSVSGLNVPDAPPVPPLLNTPLHPMFPVVVMSPVAVTPAHETPPVIVAPPPTVNVLDVITVPKEALSPLKYGGDPLVHDSVIVPLTVTGEPDTDKPDGTATP